MKDKIRKAIIYWWNDTMRKTWQIDLIDPDKRDKHFNELVDEIEKQINDSFKIPREIL